MSWIIPGPEVLNGVPPVLYLLCVAGATLLIGVSKGGFGGGVGVLATPLFLLVVPGHLALSLILPLLICCDIFTLRQFPTEWHPRSFWLLAPGIFLGLFIGLYFLLLFAKESVDGDGWIRLVVGVVSLAFCGLKVLEKIRKKPMEFRPGFGIGTVTGLLCGFTTMVAHAAGVIINMFLIAQRIDQRKFVGTCGRLYLTFNTIKIPFFLAASFLAQDHDYLTLQTLKWDLWLLPLCPVGVALGAWLNRRMSGRVFTGIIYVFLGITGAKMIYDARDVLMGLIPG